MNGRGQEKREERKGGEIPALAARGCVPRRGKEKEEEEGEVTVAVVEDRGYEHESGGKRKSVCDFIAIRGQMNQKMRFSPPTLIRSWTGRRGERS